nr:MAG TPA: hypothetical protein [Caudoviricetes sp.]
MYLPQLIFFSLINIYTLLLYHVYLLRSFLSVS